MYPAESNIKFAICIRRDKTEDLDLWKIYRVLSDTKANEVGCLRVIDESGEDYLYPANRFVIVELPEEIRMQLLAISEK